MKPARSFRLEVVGLALALAATGGAVTLTTRASDSSSAIRVAQEYASPIGEEDGPIGGPMVYGGDVGNAPIGGPMVYGGDVGDAPIGGPMIYGGDVGNAPIGGAMVGGAPVDQGSEDQPIGGDTLY